MKAFAKLLPLALAALALTGTASAQFGFGAGVASSGANLNQAAGNLSDLLAKDSITYTDVSGGFGAYVTARWKQPVGPVRLIADAAYIYFPAKEVVLTEVHVDPNHTHQAQATFEVGGSYIPLAVGLEYALPTPVVHPYLGVQLTYTHVTRTFAAVRGDVDDISPDLSNRGTGSDWGLMVGAGVELNVFSVMALDIGLRYNLENLLSKEEGVPDAKYLQLGASLFFGDLYASTSSDD
jgi:opacity protein-like surface antigen